MKRLSRIIEMAVALALIFAVSACNDKEEETSGNDDFPKAVEFTTIGKCAMYGDGSEGFSKEDLVITSQTEWEEITAKFGNPYCGVDDFRTMEIDFSAYQVIAIIEEVKPHGGYDIDITAITEYVDKIVVDVVTTSSVPALDVMTQPSHLALIPTSDKKIVFEHKEEEFPREIAFTTIGKCAMYGNGTEGFSKENLVITSQSEWEAIKTKFGNPECSINDFSTMEIDFSTYQVIAIIEEVKPDAGYSIDVTSAVEYPNHIIVTALTLRSLPAHLTVTQPFHLFILPVSDKEIVFEHFSDDLVVDVLGENLLCNLEPDIAYLFNSLEELTPYLCEGEAPNIDFDTYSVIAAHGVTTSGIDNLRFSLQEHLQNLFVLNVDIQLNDAAVIEEWTLALLTKKIDSNALVALEINQHN